MKSEMKRKAGKPGTRKKEGEEEQRKIKTRFQSGSGRSESERIQEP